MWHVSYELFKVINTDLKIDHVNTLVSSLCVCVCTGVHVCGSQSSSSYYSLGDIHFVFPDSLCHWDLGLTDLSTLANEWPCFSHTRITSGCCHTGTVMWVLRIELESSCLRSQHISNWAVSSASVGDNHDQTVLKCFVRFALIYLG